MDCRKVPGSYEFNKYGFSSVLKYSSSNDPLQTSDDPYRKIHPVSGAMKGHHTLCQYINCKLLCPLSDVLFPSL